MNAILLGLVIAGAARGASTHVEWPCNAALNSAIGGLPEMGFSIESSDRVGGFLKLGWTKGASTHAGAIKDIKGVTTVKGFFNIYRYDEFKVNGGSLTAIPVGAGCDVAVTLSYSGFVKGSGWYALPSNDTLEEAALIQIQKYPPSPGSAAQPEPLLQPAPQPPPVAIQPTRPAEWKITSEPSGAEISIDGAYQGSTPAQMSPTDGERAIKIVKRGYQPWERKLTTKPGDTRTIHADLEPAPVDPSKPKIIGLQ